MSIVNVPVPFFSQFFCSEDDKNLSRRVVRRHRWPKEIGRPPVPSRAKRRFHWAPWCQQGVRQIATFVDRAVCSIVLVATEFLEGRSQTGVRERDRNSKRRIRPLRAEYVAAERRFLGSH